VFNHPTVGKKTDYMADWGHPNDKGYNLIADLIFQQLSNDPAFLEKVNKAKAGTDADFNHGVQALLDQK